LLAVPGDPDARSACPGCIAEQRAKGEERPYAFDFYSNKPESEIGVEIRNEKGAWSFRRVLAGRFDDMSGWNPTQERYVRCTCGAVFDLRDGGEIKPEEAEWA